MDSCSAQNDINAALHIIKCREKFLRKQRDKCEHDYNTHNKINAKINGVEHLITLRGCKLCGKQERVVVKDNITEVWDITKYWCYHENPCHETRAG